MQCSYLSEYQKNGGRKCSVKGKESGGTKAHESALSEIHGLFEMYRADMTPTAKTSMN